MTNEQFERLERVLDLQQSTQTEFIEKVIQAKQSLMTLNADLENAMARISEFTC